MKYLFFLLLFLLFNNLNAQDVKVLSVTGDKTSVILCNDNHLDILLNGYYRAESDNFNLVNYYVYSNENSEQKIGKYGKRTLKLNEEDKIKFKFDKNSNTVLAINNKRDIIFEGKLIFDIENGSQLKKIEIIKNGSDSHIVEAWVTLATINHLYGNDDTDFINDILFGALVGAGITAGVALFD